MIRERPLNVVRFNDVEHETDVEKNADTVLFFLMAPNARRISVGIIRSLYLSASVLTSRLRLLLYVTLTVVVAAGKCVSVKRSMVSLPGSVGEPSGLVRTLISLLSCRWASFT